MHINTLSEKIQNFEVKNIIYILIGLLPVCLLTNKFAYGPISILAVLAILSIIYFFRGEELNYYHFKLMIILLIIAGYLLFSFFITNQSIRNLFSFGFFRYDGSFFFCYIAFFIFSVRFLDYQKALKTFFIILFLSFSIFGILGILEYFNGMYFLNVRLDDYYLGAIFVAQNNAHNATGSVYALAGIAAAAFFIKAKDRLVKLFFISTLSIIALSLLITKSRGSIAGFLTGLVFIFILSSESFLKLIRNLVIIIATMGLFVFFTGTYNRIIQMFHYTDASSLTRFSLWEKSIILFKASPIFGVGFTRYNDIPWNYDTLPLYKYAKYVNFYNWNNAIFNDTNSHNSYLGFLSETGIIGLVLFLFFWGYLLYLFIKAYKKSRNIFEKQLFLFLSGAIICLFVLSISENYMTAPTIMIFLSVVVSLSIGLLKK